MRKPATELTSLIGWSVSGRLTAGGLPESETDFGERDFRSKYKLIDNQQCLMRNGFPVQIRKPMCNRAYLQMYNVCICLSFSWEISLPLLLLLQF